jgi:hypothetical protein
MAKGPLQQLNDGELPRMVRWYDPRLLGRIGIRTLVSTVFGQYADHRLLQAATDDVGRQALTARYDFSDPDARDPLRRIELDADGALWIDYIADTGDGFEASYTMAYLLAKERLEVKGAPPLPHGQILIMGGDQCYPQATREEYRRRLQLPFGWAFNVPVPTRKLFALPGNHDWYDGLAAFDSLFCASRDRLSERKGNVIGGWQCLQHRSYWAIRLPHRWWLWGTDIQFSKYLDVSQVNYFETVARDMGPEDKLILCMAQPAWMLADFQGQDEEQNFLKITALARKSGAKICAVLAGDWHHYNRYLATGLGVHFITAGGGGAFLHPTHVLKNEIAVPWPEPKLDSVEPSTTGAAATRGWEPLSYDGRLKKAKGDVVGVVKDVVHEVLHPLRDIRPRARRTAPLRSRAPKCYPPKAVSRLLSLRNLLFPVFNLPFSLGIGIIYWLVTWQFHTVVRQYDISAGKIDHVGIEVPLATLLGWMPVYVLQATLSVGFAFMLFGLLAVLVWYVDAVERPGPRRYLVKLAVGGGHFLAHAAAMFSLFLVFMTLNNAIAPIVESEVDRLLRMRSEEANILRGLVQETLEPLSRERKLARERTDAIVGRAAPPAPAAPDADAKSAEPNTVRELVGLLYPLQMVLVGGLLGGLIWGCYWVVTGLFGRMHAEDAFAALRIQDYKNFLRIKLEPDQVTIYPIGLDRVPRKADWMSAPVELHGQGHNPALIPVKQIQIHLIEEPIVIRPDEVR